MTKKIPKLFDPRLFASREGAAWFRRAVELYPKKTGMRPDDWCPAREMPNLVGSTLDPEWFRTHPELINAGDDIVRHALQHGDERLRIELNALGRAARLFAADHTKATVPFGGSSIILHLKEPPRLTSPSSLREFLYAVAAANPRYAGDPRRIDPKDPTDYLIHTPQEIVTRSIARMVTLMQLHHAQEHDPRARALPLFEIPQHAEITLIEPSAAFQELLVTAGIKAHRPAKAPSMSTHRTSLEERYFLARKYFYRRDGFSLEYALLRSLNMTALPASEDPFFVIHRGRIILITEQLETFPREIRRTIAHYFALRAHGLMLFESATHATHLMLAHAHRDGWLSVLLDSLVGYAPAYFLRTILPHLDVTAIPRLPTPASWHTALHQHALTTLKWNAAPLDDYRRPFAHAGNGNGHGAANGNGLRNSSSNGNGNGIRNSSGNGAPSGTQQHLHPHQAIMALLSTLLVRLTRTDDIRHTVARMALEGASWHALRHYVATSAAASRTRAETIYDRYASWLRPDTARWPVYERLLTQLCNDDVTEELTQCEQDIAHFLERIHQRTSPSCLAWQRYRATGHFGKNRHGNLLLWEDVRALVGDTQDFLSLRYAHVATVEKWTPLAEVAASARPLVMLARERSIDRFGGDLPKSNPTTGKDLQHAPLRTFLRTGRITFSEKHPPWRFVAELETALGLRFGDAVHPDTARMDPHRAFRHARSCPTRTARGHPHLRRQTSRETSTHRRRSQGIIV